MGSAVGPESNFNLYRTLWKCMFGPLEPLSDHGLKGGFWDFNFDVLSSE